VNALYTVWIKLEGTLPWIELKGEYDTRKEASQAADQARRKMAVKIVTVSQQKRPMPALATIKVRR
jgi:hypothetical protein